MDKPEGGRAPGPTPGSKLSSKGISGRSALILAISIVAVSYGLFFYLQGVVQKEFRDSLFEQHQARQIESTKAIAQHISSDFDAVSTELELVASAQDIRSGDFVSDRSKAAIEKAGSEINSHHGRASDPNPEGAIVDGLYLVDSKGIVAADVWPSGDQSIAGTDISDRQYAVDTKQSGRAQLSTGYVGSDGILRIAATHPIVGENGEYVGMVVATMPAGKFFQHYGNIYDIQSQYMAVLDTDATQLVHPVPSLLGTNFFGEYTQNITGHNAVLNAQIREVMAGSASNSVYEFVNGERFNTGHPILFRNQPVYFVFIITPTSLIYSDIDSILSAQRMEGFTVLAGTTISIAILIFLLARWNSGLNREVEARTREISESNLRLMRLNSQLEESNRQLAFANEKMIAINMQLEKNEKIQKDFINVAAHELRTPIQPILGLAELMHGKTTDPEMLEIVDTIERSAKRLLRLSSDILDAARIDGQGLGMEKEEFELNELLLRTVQEYLSQFQRQNVALNFEPGPKAIISADRGRIAQVVSNLLSNAAKFTESGSATLSVKTSGTEVVVTVRDTGRGIDPEVIPRLFTKFATKSEKGTGLGLFISKNIVETHGGRIWGSNNIDGRGANFGFSLPLADSAVQPAERVGRVSGSPVKAGQYAEN